MGQDALNKGSQVAKKAGKKFAKKAMKQALKAIKKLFLEFIKLVINTLLKGLFLLFGWEAVLIILAIIVFAGILSAIPFGDWTFNSSGQRTEVEILVDQEYQNKFIALAEASTVEIDNEIASDSWKATLKSIVQPSWAIPASFARYQMIRTKEKIELPNPKKMFEGLEPSFTFTTVKDDKAYTKTIKACYTEVPVLDSTGKEVKDSEGKPVLKKVYSEPTESTKESDMPNKKILASAVIPFGTTAIKSVVKYYPGGYYEDKGEWEFGGTSNNGNCKSTTYHKWVKTEVDDRGVPSTEFDADLFKEFIVSKGVKENHLDEYFEYVLAAEPDFPIELYQGEYNGGSANYGNADYVFEGNVIDGWVWPIGIDYRGVNSPMGPRWGKMHNGIDLGGRAWPEAAILAARDGLVIYEGWSDSYGNWVIISHDNDLQTRYAHMTKIMVKSGAQVTAGQQIGTQGNTGASKGAHLHFEVIKPNPKNPLGRSSDADKVYDPMFFLGPLK